MNSLASLAIGLMACAASFHSRCTGDLVKIAQLKIGRQTKLLGEVHGFVMRLYVCKSGVCTHT